MVKDYETPMPGVFDRIHPYIGDSELWCHRTRDKAFGVFMNGLRVKKRQPGLRCMATHLTNRKEFPILEEAVEEFTTRFDPENPMNNARVFIVVPPKHRELIEPIRARSSIDRPGILPSRFVLAHIILQGVVLPDVGPLPDGQINMNPNFDATVD